MEQREDKDKLKGKKDVMSHRGWRKRILKGLKIIYVSFGEQVFPPFT